MPGVSSRSACDPPLSEGARGDRSPRRRPQPAAAPDSPRGRALAAGGLRQTDAGGGAAALLRADEHPQPCCRRALHADRLRPRDGADADRSRHPGRTEIYAVVRISADPDNERAEYAILVRHDMTGMGLGILLMRRIIDYARRRGIRRDRRRRAARQSHHAQVVQGVRLHHQTRPGGPGDRQGDAAARHGQSEVAHPCGRGPARAD